MKQNLLRSVLLAQLVVLAGCQRPEPLPLPRSKSTPKTFFGQSVGKAKDLSRNLSERDRQVERQAEEAQE